MDRTSSPVPAATNDGQDDPWRALFRRWFVEYNPLYLASATLVLGGLWLIARENAGNGSFAGIAAVGAVTELYALALIAAAAFLVRTGMRRAGVMLGLLVVLFQGDPMMRVEAYAFTGGGGGLLSAAWVVLFAVKLITLAAALELRLSRAALAVPTFGALALAATPHLLRELAPADRGAPVAIVVFAIGALGLWTVREVQSAVGFDVRGVRSVRGTWALWVALALAHVTYWGDAFGVDLVALAPVALLLATRFAGRERGVWALVVLALACALVVRPGSLSLIAAMSAVVLALRAWRTPIVAPPSEPPPRVEPPYRGSAPARPDALDAVPLPIARFARAERAAVVRLVTGALACAHLAGWSRDLSMLGAWPAHDLALDLALALGCAALAWRHRAVAVPLAPVTLVWAHLAHELGCSPSSIAQWGWASVIAGFALLGGGVLASLRLRRTTSVRALEPAQRGPNTAW